jgi:hypothetical protein
LTAMVNNWIHVLLEHVAVIDDSASSAVNPWLNTLWQDSILYLLLENVDV